MPEEAWFAADEIWPSHPNKEWRKAMKRFRFAGWFLRVHSSHAFGSLYCRKTTDSNYCEVKVLQSGYATEFAIKRSIKMIDKCPHKDLRFGKGGNK